MAHKYTHTRKKTHTHTYTHITLKSFLEYKNKTISIIIVYGCYRKRYKTLSQLSTQVSRKTFKNVWSQALSHIFIDINIVIQAWFFGPRTCSRFWPCCTACSRFWHLSCFSFLGIKFFISDMHTLHKLHYASIFSFLSSAYCIQPSYRKCSTVCNKGYS